MEQILKQLSIQELKVNRIKLLLFTLSGLVCGIAGVLTTSRLAVARFNMATGAELEIVLMVMLGGTYIFEGRGNIFGTFIAFWIVVIFEGRSKCCKNKNRVSANNFRSYVDNSYYFNKLYLC